jgi:hypothetical protein
MARSQYERSAAYRRTPRGAYAKHRENAKRRGVAFRLTFKQWMGIWALSGHWHERGCSPYQFVMCRHFDLGAYEVGNVYIAQNRHNLHESTWTRHLRGAPQSRAGGVDLTP